VKLGPSYLLKRGLHDVGHAQVLDIGGMLHKSFQLVGNINGAMVDIFGSIDPHRGGTTTWIPIGRLSAADPYKHHTGFLRWIKVVVAASDDRADYGVAIMGED
jgi:hypothetical protein